jgi:hypothetical protein
MALSGRFCSGCGEPAAGPAVSLWSVFREGIGDLFSIDGKIFRTVAALMIKPGHLTAEYFAGRRKRYARPFAVLLVSSLIYFIVQPHTNFVRRDFDTYVAMGGWYRDAIEGRIENTAEPRAVFRARFDTLAGIQGSTAMLVLTPLLALLARALYWRRSSYLVKHLVFSVHFFAYFMLYVALVMIPVISLLPERLDNDRTILPMLLVGTIPYVFFALRRIHGEGWWRTGVKTAVLGVAFYSLALRGYSTLLFMAVMRGL